MPGNFRLRLLSRSALKKLKQFHKFCFWPKTPCRERKPFCRIAFTVSGIVPHKMGHLKFCEGVSFMYQEIEFEHLEASDLQVVDVWSWTGLGWLKIETGSCECGNEPSGYIKCGQCLDWVGNC